MDSPSWQVSDLTLRLVVVGVVVTSVVAIVLFLRLRDRAPSRSLGTVPLGPGIYLFTSASCADCHAAREILEGAFGSQRFVEYAWESDPGIFDALSIDKVPCTVTVDEAGRGTLWIGRPDRMIYAVDP